MKEFFFNVISVSQCKSILASFPRCTTEELDFRESIGRFLAEDIVSKEDLPLADRASMDGYAVRSADVFGASEGNPAYLEQSSSVEIGSIPDFELNPGNCAAIVTGAYLPDGADAVVMVEHTQNLGAGTIEIRRSLAPHDNVMLRGEDVKQGAVLLPAGTFIRAQELGFMAALGVNKAKVYRLPSVGVLSTGDELVDSRQPIRPGQIRDVNSPALCALIQALGMKAAPLGIVPDDKKTLTSAICKALEQHDVVLLSGGSSVGGRDYTVEVLSGLPGSKMLVQGVAMSPGKPLIVASINSGSNTKAVIGLPGQITSAQVVMHILILPFLRHLAGLGSANACNNSEGIIPALASGHLHLPALLARNIASRQGREDYIRVRLEYPDPSNKKHPDNLPLAHPIQGKSGLVRTLVEAHGLLCIPSDLEGFEAGSRHDIIML